jgi:hypothetical protein
MYIIYENYKLEVEQGRFNLLKFRPKTNKKTRVVTDNYYVLGYGKTFEACIYDIIIDKLADRNETFTLHQYIDEYKALKTKILDEIELPKRK